MVGKSRAQRRAADEVRDTDIVGIAKLYIEAKRSWRDLVPLSTWPKNHHTLLIRCATALLQAAGYCIDEGRALTEALDVRYGAA